MTTTKNLAEANPPSSGIFYRGGAPAQPASAALDETASYVLDDFDFPPGQVESPSQISQGTLPVASETEDTLAGAPAEGVVAPRRSASVVPLAPLPAEAAPQRLNKVVLAVGLVVAVLGAAVLAAWWFDLIR